MAIKTVFITSVGTGTYTIPSDFQALVSVEAIGGGGGGGAGQLGGGGGAYAKSTAISGLTAGGTAYYRVGRGADIVSGSVNSESTDSWFNTSNAAPTSALTGVLAKAGGSTTAAGGSAASCVGTIAYSGGNGGSGYHGGGGGAAGPGGAGGNGGNGLVSSACGGGGGGASLTAAGNNGATATVTNVGGNGGNGGIGSGGGAGGSSSAGTAGTAGTGGGGGGQGGGSAAPGGAGATGSTSFIQTSNSATAGSGGGGGGAGGGSSATAGSGGLYGGGGGNGGSAASVSGAQGIVVFTYSDAPIKTVFITTQGASTFTIPSDFGTLVAVEAIGGGGSGSLGNTKTGGAGGGAYAKSTSVTGLVAGQTVYVNVGVGGTVVSKNLVSATGSWFNATANSAPTLASQGVFADYGKNPSGGAGGAGGLDTNCVGDVKYSGGSGGLSPVGNNAGGGGGAAGPGGAGGTGGAGYNGGNGPGGTSSGGGGSGATLTAAGTIGQDGQTSAGGAGGASTGQTGGSGATSTLAANNTAPANGGGGGGGCSAQKPGGNGATGSVSFTQTSNGATAGSGGGGGGGDGSGSGSLLQNGGLYGGGGGGCTSTSVAFGGQGIVVFSYYQNTNLPSSGTNVTGRQDTGFKVFDGLSQTSQDLGQRYVSKDYLLDVYPNIASATGTRTAPGLWGWGMNNTSTSQGSAIGNSSLNPTSSPVQVGLLTNWKQVTTSSAGVTLAIKTDGTLWAWGNNVNGVGGALGTSDTTSRSSPVQVGTLTNWKQVTTANNSTSAAVKTDGTLWVWGLAGSGALGNGTTIPLSSPVQIGSLTNWKQVAGDCDNVNSMWAVKNDGTLWAWGANGTGQLGLGDTTNRSSPVQVGTLTNWKQVTNGTSAIKTDGTLWTWGSGGSGQLGDGTTVTKSSPVQVGTLINWKSVVKLASAAIAIKTDGTLWAWGANTGDYLGVLGTGDTIPYSSPIQVGSLTNWKQVTVSHILPTGGGAVNGCIVQAIKTDGTLWGWGNLPYSGGSNNGGSFGNGVVGQSNTTISYSSPIQIGSLTNWKSVVAGGVASLAIQDGYI